MESQDSQDTQPEAPSGPATHTPREPAGHTSGPAAHTSGTAAHTSGSAGHTPDPAGEASGPAGEVPARVEAVVDLAAIRHNVETLHARARGAEVMVVVKAEGYGHGAVPAARAALDGGASWLGVAYAEEALELRAAGLTAPRILSWLAAPGERFVELLRADVDVAAYSPWQLAEIAEAARAAGRAALVHLKVDTGLSRGGATLADWPALLDAALSAEADGTVRIVGIWSHLACADTPKHPANALQARQFEQALDFARRVGVTPEVRHLAGSAGLLGNPEATTYDLVRLGISAYGLSPGPELGTPETLGLRPAMTLRARLASVKRTPAGSGVSYGHTYTTRAETSLGLVPLGYADGIPRAASNRAEVLVAGARRTIAGTVCMDQFVVDLGNDPAEPGDEVLLFGPGTRGEPTAQEWAERLGTIGYEIVTRIGARVPRRYAS